MKMLTTHSAAARDDGGLRLHTSISIPDQTVKLRVKMHTSKVSYDADMSAKVSCSPSGAKLEQRTPVVGNVSDSRHPVSGDLGDNLHPPGDSQSKGGKKASGQPSTAATAYKDHHTGATGSMYPVQSSATKDGDFTPRGPKLGFGSLNRSVGRTFARSRLISRWFKPESSAKGDWRSPCYPKTEREC